MIHARGTTFIEILVSLVIVSLILLGLDAMQLTALRETKISYYYAEATQQLHVMQERLLAPHHSDPTDAIQQWNQQNAAILPRGRGSVREGVISVFWGDAAVDDCHVNKIGLSGCVSSAIKEAQVLF